MRHCSNDAPFVVDVGEDVVGLVDDEDDPARRARQRRRQGEVGDARGSPPSSSASPTKTVRALHLADLQV